MDCFIQAEDGIRETEYGLEFRRVLFRSFIDRGEVHRRYEANFLVAPSPKRQFEQSAQAFSHWEFGIDGIGENEGPFVFGSAGQVIDMVIEKGKIGRASCRDRVCQYV